MKWESVVRGKTGGGRQWNPWITTRLLLGKVGSFQIHKDRLATILGEPEPSPVLETAGVVDLAGGENGDDSLGDGGPAGALVGFAGAALACFMAGWPLVWP
jgi:hypothetical protein